MGRHTFEDVGAWKGHGGGWGVKQKGKEVEGERDVKREREIYV